MSLINSAPTQAPIPVVPRRKLSTRLLNFFLGNPVRALFTCIVFVWIPLALTIRSAIHG